MAGYIAAKSISLPVASAEVITQRRFVKVGTTGNAEQVDAVTDIVVGVALEGSALNDTAAIPVAVLDGAVLEVEAGGTVAIGSLVGSAADGQAVAVTAATSRAVGVALSAGVDGQVMRIIGGVNGFAANAT